MQTSSRWSNISKYAFKAQHDWIVRRRRENVVLWLPLCRPANIFPDPSSASIAALSGLARDYPIV